MVLLFLCNVICVLHDAVGTGSSVCMIWCHGMWFFVCILITSTESNPDLIHNMYYNSNIWPEFLFSLLLDSSSPSAAAGAVLPPYPQSLSKPHVNTAFEVISIHQSSSPGPALAQPSAHLFLPPSSHPNPSHWKQLWSPLGIFHPALTQWQFKPSSKPDRTHFPSLAAHVTGLS